MPATFAVIWASAVIGITGAIWTMPSWCFAEIVRVKLEMLRGQLLDDITAGRLPMTPAVCETVESVELVIVHHKYYRILDVLLLGRLARQLATGCPYPGPDLPVRALTLDEQRRLSMHHDRLRQLTAALLMSSAWLGVVTVLWFFVRAGFRSLHDAVEAADGTPLCQTAKRNAMRSRRLAHHG